MVAQLWISPSNQRSRMTRIKLATGICGVEKVIVNGKKPHTQHLSKHPWLMEEFIPGSDNKQDNIPTFPKATCNIPWMGMNHVRPLGGENPHRPCCHRHFTADKMTLLLVTVLQILWHTSAQKTLIICLWWKVKHPASSFEVINTSSVQETFQGLSKFNQVSELLDNNQSQPGFFVQFYLPFSRV